MVHTQVVVALHSGGTRTGPFDPAALSAALAPFDAARSVDPYPDYTEFQGRPSGFWAVKYLRAHCGLDTPDEELTWEQVAEVYNTAFAPAEGEPPILFDGAGAPYHASTHNPEERWDHWCIGGRWSGAFRVHPRADPDDLVGLTEGPDGPRADGGRRRALDFAAMRADAGAGAARAWHAFERCAARHPPALGWSTFARLVSPDYPRPRAEDDYRSQPLVAELYPTELSDVLDFALDAPGADLHSYVARRRLAATTGAALLTADGQWIDEPFAGWVGSPPEVRSAADSYRRRAAAYLDTLPPDTWLAVVDAHS
ncbi:hypothetical protein [Nocardiopsis coralliicola]